MSQILSVEVDGEIGGTEDHGRRRFPGGFGLPVVVALVGIVVMAGSISMLSGLVLYREGALSVGAPGGEAVIAGSQPADRREPNPRIERAKGALSAWGEFAASGDVTRLDGWFDPNGPQHRMLTGEASVLQWRPGPPYTVTASEEKVVAEHPNEAVVEATVRWTRSGEPGQVYQWEIVMRGGPDNPWSLWTVRAPAAKVP